jgi:hypothetical protein
MSLTTKERTMAITMCPEDQLVDWILNVWDELGEETTRADIVRDFTAIVGDATEAENLVTAWFEDHAEILSCSIGVPVMNLMIYEDSVRTWVYEHMDEDGEFYLS